MPGNEITPLEQALMISYQAQMDKDWDLAEHTIMEVYQKNPNEPRVNSELLRVYKLSKQYKKGIELLEQWLSTHPGDPVAQKELKSLQGMLEEITLEKTNISKKKLKKIYKGKVDWFMSAEEALKLGVVDEILD